MNKNPFSLEGKQPVQVYDVGNHVECDLCCKDYTESDEKGGMIFGSKGVCRPCMEKMMPDVIAYNETKYIKAVCPPEMTFREFCLEARGGNNSIKFYEL